MPKAASIYGIQACNISKIWIYCTLVTNLRAAIYIAESTSIIKAAFVGHTQSLGKILEDKRSGSSLKQPPKKEWGFSVRSRIFLSPILRSLCNSDTHLFRYTVRIWITLLQICRAFCCFSWGLWHLHDLGSQPPLKNRTRHAAHSSG